MICGIYARKSTEQNGVIDEERSVTRQVEHAKAFAARKGWVVADTHIYVDDGISGAEFGDKRPEFLRLMNALPRREFQVLVMSEESRLGREQIKTAYALQQITEADVRVWFYLTDQERKLDTAMDKMMASLSNFGAEMEREKASQRTHDAMARKAQAFHVVGGKVYGYDNIDVMGPDGTRLHVTRRINPVEAAIVRRVFERYASGTYGLSSLAKELNAEGVPAPQGSRRGWAPSCIREILHRELYRGMVIWNKTQAIYRGGTKKSRKRPESEWVRLPHAPDLEIIPADLWQRVRARTTHVQHQYIRSSKGRLLGHPSGADLRSDYLLTGLAQCGVCGGSLAVQKRSQNQAANCYMCVFHHKRGPIICSNDLRIKQGLLDSALLHGLTAALDERLIAEAVQRALAEIRAGQTMFPNERLALERQLSLVEARIRHFVNAIGSTGATTAILDGLRTEEADKETLIRRLSHLDGLIRVASLDAKRIVHDLKGRVADMKGLLGRHLPQTRQMLRKLIDGRVVCTPFHDARGRGYEITATGTYAGLFGEELLLVNDGGGGQGS